MLRYNGNISHCVKEIKNDILGIVWHANIWHGQTDSLVFGSVVSCLVDIR